MFRLFVAFLFAVILQQSQPMKKEERNIVADNFPNKFNSRVHKIE